MTCSRSSHFLLPSMLAVFALVATHARTDELPPNLRVSENPLDRSFNIDTRRRPILENARVEREFPSVGVKLSSRFDGGRLTEATLSSDGFVEALIEAENYPINHSAWYCFRVERLPNASAREIKIRLKYPQDTNGRHRGTHRYWPKISRDGGKTWIRIPAERYESDRDKNQAELTLHVDDRPILVSGQELETSQRSKEWTQRMAEKAFVSVEVVGRTPLANEIRMLHISEDGAVGKREVFILSRLHPPEVTGTFAMRAFVEYLCSARSDAQEFRRYFNVRVVPMANPDGVDYGHWRHNRGGVDLNRDWSESAENGRNALFHQPETQIIATAFERYEAGQVAFGIDFHSTFRDVFYLPVKEHRLPRSGNRENDIAMNWLRRIARSNPRRNIYVQEVSDRSFFNSSSVAWMHRRFGCPVATYEVGDEKPRDQLVASTESDAKAFIEELLSSVSVEREVTNDNGTVPQQAEAASEGFYKDIFMSGGVSLTSRKQLFAAESAGLSYEYYAGNNPMQQNELVIGTPDDENGVLLYPDGQPRFRMVYVNGGGATHHGKSLTEKGRQRLREFNRNGGSYCGSCAGAWLSGVNVGQRQGAHESYLHIFPYNLHHTGLNKTHLHHKIPETSPLLDYRQFGEDKVIEDVRHNGGNWLSMEDIEDLAGTEVLATYDKPNHRIHGGAAIWAYRKNEQTGRVVDIGSHPEEVETGERLALTEACFLYALDGTGVPAVKGTLYDGELRTMDRRTSDDDPAFTRIGDRQIHHFRFEVTDQAPSVRIALRTQSPADLNLLVHWGSPAFRSNARYDSSEPGGNETLEVKLDPGIWYASVECASTVDAVNDPESGFYRYRGDTEVLNGIAYTIQMSCDR